MSNALTPLPLIRLIAAGLVALLVGAVLLGRCSAPGRLPAGVQLAVDRHVAASVADTVTTNRLERVAAAAIAKSTADSAARVHAERTAAAAGRRADSLAAIAEDEWHNNAFVMPTSLRSDSAELLWHVAYLARTDEDDSLLTALHQAGAELQARAARQAASDSTADVWKAHALRGDSVIAQLLPLAQRADRCRILWVVSCPTRKQAFVAGAITAAAVKEAPQILDAARRLLSSRR